MNLSLIVLTRNEENIVEDNIKKINNFLENSSHIQNYEIIVSDYSHDSTFSILESLSKENSNILPVKSPRPGIGCGLVSGMNLAVYEYLIFYPIDMAWDIKIIRESVLELEKNCDVALGSRDVKNASSKRPLKRKIFSKGYNILINFLFHLEIKDTQGTIGIKKNDYEKYKNKLMSDGAFLQTELLIYSKMDNLRIKEIPSIVIDTRKDSSVKVFSFAIEMLKNALEMRKRLRQK